MASKILYPAAIALALLSAPAAAADDNGTQHSLSLDLLISSMDSVAAETDSITDIDATIDYLCDIFDSADDPDHPQLIGGNSYLMKRPRHGLRHDVVANVSEFHSPVRGRVSSKFGPRGNNGHIHRGIDIALAVGDTVCAAFPGRVELCGFDPHGYGYYLLMSHPNGLQTLYAHLDKFLVTPEITVKAGTPIALGGRSGNSTAPHLHFETRCQAIPIDPADIADFSTGQPRRATYIVKASDCDNSKKHSPEKISVTGQKHRQ